MKEIANETFVNTYLQCWVKAFSNPEMARAWHGAHDWTVEHMNKVLYPLAKKLGYCDKQCEYCCSSINESDTECKPNCKMYGTNLQQEYYKVDFSLYDSKGDDGWSLDYAIEHENAAFELKDDKTVKYSGWFNEFMKLLPLNCANARVIIGYDEFLGENGSKFEEKLDKCMSRLKSEAVIPSLVQKPIILIIFPYTEAMRKKVKEYGRQQTALLRAVQFVWANDKWERHDIAIDNPERIHEVYQKITAKN